MNLYTVVDSSGNIVLSLVPLSTITLEPGQRALPDNPPDPRTGAYLPGYTKPLRIEPVPITAEEIVYEIVPDEGSDMIIISGDLIL